MTSSLAGANRRSTASGAGAGPDSRALVIGAGVIGITAALALRRAGYEVTVIDRLGPGEGCSFGNSGAMPRDHAFPLATPGILREVPRFLTDRLGPLYLRPAYVPRLLPWLLGFVRASTRAAYPRIVERLLELMRLGHEEWGALIAEAALAWNIKDNNALTLYRDAQARDRAWGELGVLRALGAPFRRIETDELATLEPHLPRGYSCAILEPGYRHALDPYKIPLGLAEHFLAGGGNIRRETGSELVIVPHKVRAIRTNHAVHEADLFVIAAGAWSGRFTAQLGYRVPLESARGYHVTLREPGVMPQNVLSIADLRVSLTPLSIGLRLGANIELAGLDSVPDFARATRQISTVRHLYPQARIDPYTTWAGDRPMLPDSLPVIGRCRRHRNVIFAFGHGQYGLALAAITAKLVAQLATGERTSVDLDPYRIDRF